MQSRDSRQKRKRDRCGIIEGRSIGYLGSGDFLSYDIVLPAAILVFLLLVRWRIRYDRSPLLNLVTDKPTSSTTPATPLPRMKG